MNRYIAAPQKASKNKGLFLISVLCFVVGAIIRIGYCLKYPVQPRDAYKYLDMIEKWEESGRIGEVISFYPLSLWILKAPKHFFDYDLLKGGISINILIGLLLLLIIINVSYNIFHDLLLSLIIGLIVAAHPMLVQSSCAFLRENPYLFFSFITLVFLVEYYIKKSWISIAASGIFGALAFLCRVEGIEVFLFVAFIMLWFFLKKRTLKGVYFFHMLLFAVCFALCFMIVCHILSFEFLPLNLIFNKIDMEMPD